MRFEYKGNILYRILARNAAMPIDFIYVNAAEMTEIEEACLERGVDFTRKSDWMTVSGYDFTIYETE